MISINIGRLTILASLTLASISSSCTRQDEFYSVAIGELSPNSDPTEIEFFMPKADNDLIAISGELLGSNINYEAFVSSLQFKIEFYYKDGRSEITAWLSPTISNWHNPKTSFVISKEIVEKPENRVVKIRLSTKRKELEVSYKSRIKIYSNYLK